MKKKLTAASALLLAVSLATTASAATNGASSGGGIGMLFALIALIGITVLAFIISIVLTASLAKASKKSGHGKMKGSFKILITCAYIVAILALVCTIACGVKYKALTSDTTAGNDSSQTGSTGDTEESTTPSETDGASTPTGSEPAPTETDPIETEPPEPTYSLGTVTHGDTSDPDSWIKSYDIILNDSIVDSYTRGENITFGDPTKESYFALPGIATFRGDNYRTGSSYGTANIVENTMTAVWTRKVGSIAKGSASGAWTGCGWTGQPLIVEWDEETKQIMNMYEEKKAKEGLVEVIYATLDGNIYFYDLEDGTYTRDPLYIGMAFKGAGALDPRGYPIMYVGSGDLTASGSKPRMYIINLLDCSVMYEYGNAETYNYRSWIAFDSSPLVDAETDTLIWPGESGVLYTMKLNTNYDKAAGTLSIAPSEMVKTRYTTNTSYNVGCENSAIIVENYLYFGDNGGFFFCIDLNTMEMVWVQNTLDDVNATPVFEWGEDGKGYIYTATSMENAEGSIYIYKLDAATGDIVWKVEYDEVYYDYSVSGGVLASPVLGKAGTELEGMVIYAIAKIPGAYSGKLVALDTDTGDVIWEKDQSLYSWSSPIAVYADDGSAKLIVCDAGGYIYLIDPLTGETLERISVGSNVEATPAVYNDMLVVGTRGQEVYGIKLG